MKISTTVAENGKPITFSLGFGGFTHAAAASCTD
jgi:hypothetical protein